MQAIDPPFALDITPERNVGADGNNDWQALAETRMVVSLGAPNPVDGKGSRYSQSGTVFVPRGYDLKHGDRIPYDGAHYAVIGKPRGTTDHAITGDEFWAAYTITGGG